VQQFADANENIRFVGRVLSGMGSGLVASVLSCPAEVMLVRMANDISQPIEQRRHYRHVGNAFVRITKEEGITAFFRGLGPFANRAVVVGVVQIGCYVAVAPESDVCTTKACYDCGLGSYLIIYAVDCILW